MITISRYNNAKVKLVFHNTPQEDRVILCSDISMTEQEILEHYSKRNYIEAYFKEVKQNFGLKPQIFSAKSTERHVELVISTACFYHMDVSEILLFCQRPNRIEGFSRETQAKLLFLACYEKN